VLDFGLAKAVAGDGSTSDLTQSPTMTVRGTHHGMILGTAAYMSPEQARGKPVDKRTDIWAFGCVLYEMLTGHKAFARETFTDTLAAIIERDPEWKALPQATPPGIIRLLRRCLEKDPTHRPHDVASVRRGIDETSSGTKVPVERQASIAVLAFTDMSAAKDQDWFCDGIAEEIINALTPLKGLKVAARTSAFSFKGRGAGPLCDAKGVGDEHRPGDPFREGDLDGSVIALLTFSHERCALEQQCDRARQCGDADVTSIDVHKAPMATVGVDSGWGSAVTPFPPLFP
jgi:hypothetical protein